MKDEILKCPECWSTEVTVSHLQRFMANTGEHYCHSVKTQDAASEATCLDCKWVGRRDQLVHNVQIEGQAASGLSSSNAGLGSAKGE